MGEHVKTTPGLQRMITRLACGRQARHLADLMNTHLFRAEPPPTPHAPTSLAVQPGLFGRYANMDVFIVDVFTKWRVRKADILPLVPKDAEGTSFTVALKNQRRATRTRSET